MTSFNDIRTKWDKYLDEKIQSLYDLSDDIDFSTTASLRPVRPTHLKASQADDSKADGSVPSIKTEERPTWTQAKRLVQNFNYKQEAIAKAKNEALLINLRGTFHQDRSAFNSSTNGETLDPKGPINQIHEHEDLPTDDELDESQINNSDLFGVLSYSPTNPTATEHSEEEADFKVNLCAHSLGFNSHGIRRGKFKRANNPGNNISVEVISEKFRSVFENEFSHFNSMQSKVFDSVYKDNQTLVVCAPTGSGKTVIFELAIVKELEKRFKHNLELSSLKVVYIAPLKTLCHERYIDWTRKFSPFSLICSEVTGDTNPDDYTDLRRVSIILTTPEKLDYLTRSREYQTITRSIRLILIDEVHLLNDEGRGPKLEALVSRFKMVQKMAKDYPVNYRFIAVSATTPNCLDIVEWLSSQEDKSYNIADRAIVLSDKYRSVRLETKVLGFHCASSWNDFFFENTLNSKLSSIITYYSQQKPTLVFVATRKSCYQTAKKLAEDSFVGQSYNHVVLQRLQQSLKDPKLKENIIKGVAYHHAGLSSNDRILIEEHFDKGWIPVLVSTSTLALGVNLPAFLVIIKGTFHYVNGECIEYTESEISQMIGRAGRPNICEYGRAIIMTKKQSEPKYKKLVSGTQTIESHLPKYLCECLNAEIVLQTISNMTMALEWMNSTFFSIRVRKDPVNYGMDPTWTDERINEKLTDMCRTELNGLKKYDLIRISEDGGNIQSSPLGILMAIKSIHFDTMKRLVTLKGEETLQQLLTIVCKCEEVKSITRLRVNEKRFLNSINCRSKNDPSTKLIRFPLEGKIRSDDMKANVLIQATFGGIEIEPSLSQDSFRIIKSGERVSRCLAEVAWIKYESFRLLLNSLILTKCFRAQMWENSSYIVKQLPKIGPKMADSLVNACLSTFEDIESADPRKIELFVNRRPPFGREIIEAAKRIPRYEVSVRDQSLETRNGILQVIIEIRLINLHVIDMGKNHGFTLLVGDSNDKVLQKTRVYDRLLLKNDGLFQSSVRIESVASIFIHVLSDYYVGIDHSYEYFPKFSAAISTSWGERPIRRIHSIDRYFDSFVATSPPKKVKKSSDSPSDSEITSDEDVFA